MCPDPQESVESSAAVHSTWTGSIGAKIVAPVGMVPSERANRGETAQNPQGPLSLCRHHPSHPSMLSVLNSLHSMSLGRLEVVLSYM